MLECVGDPISVDWRRIIGWLNGHVPVIAALVRSPADAGTVEAIAGDVGVALPADLCRWWALTDGFPAGAVEALIPWIHVPLPTVDAREERRHLLAVSASVPRSEEGMDAEAGGFSHWYQPAFVPISTDHCG